MTCGRFSIWGPTGLVTCADVFSVLVLSVLVVPVVLVVRWPGPPGWSGRVGVVPGAGQASPGGATDIRVGSSPVASRSARRSVIAPSKSSRESKAW